MAQQHTIEFEIKTDGTVSFTVRGIKGGGCTDVARIVSEATGFEVEHVEHTPEFYETPSAVVDTVRNGGGGWGGF